VWSLYLRKERISGGGIASTLELVILEVTKSFFLLVNEAKVIKPSQMLI
jgi:hypothetical protein